MLVGTLAPNSVGMIGRFSEPLCESEPEHKYWEKQAAEAGLWMLVAGGYLQGGCVCHPLLHDSGCGLWQDASSGLGFDNRMTLDGGGHSAGS